MLKTLLDLLYRGHRQDVPVIPDCRARQKLAAQCLSRDYPQKALQNFRMRTVIYGMACAPFEVIRMLQQLTQHEGAAFLLAVKALRSPFYVDNFLAGADIVTEAIDLRDDLIEILKTAWIDFNK